MNLSAITGIFLAIGVALYTALTSTENSKVFLDIHGFVIVMGGTLAAALVSFSGGKIFALLKVFFRNVLGANAELKVTMSEIVDLATGYRENDAYLKESIPKLKSHFLREAVQLMIDGGMEPEELEKILKKRALTRYQMQEEDAEIFHALSKFPPAFGLLGAVIGMIAMMQNLGGADSMSKVGPSLAVALVATLYGIALANFVFLPLAENLKKLNRSDATIRQMVIDGVKLIRLKKHPLFVQESIVSYLSPSDRNKLKKAA